MKAASGRRRLARWKESAFSSLLMKALNLLNSLPRHPAAAEHEGVPGHGQETLAPAFRSAAMR
jgi:hypothetical protein